MPRNVRNFWITVDVDGYKSRVASGPVRKDGGFDLEILQRDNGSIRSGLEVLGRATKRGLLLSVYHDGKLLLDFLTQR